MSLFHFIRPGWLLLVPLVIGLWCLWQRRADPLRGWRDQIDPQLLDALLTGKNAQKSSSAYWILAAWLIAILAIAGPTWRLEPSPFADDSMPLIIVMKADLSMETPDPAPSRLERAKLKISDLAAARKGQPLGLIAYAGSAHLVLPPTRDTAIVARMAAEIAPDIMPSAGDRLDLALREAARVLDEGSQIGRIVVLADSVDTDPDLLEQLKKELRLPIYFLAINSPESSQDASLRAAAKIFNSKVAVMDFEGKDIASIVRYAAGGPGIKNGRQDERWQDAGYWLVPLIALILLPAFRREISEEASA